MQWLVVFLLLIIIYLFAKRKKSDVKRDKEVDIMVECSSCRTFVSSEDALIKDGKYFCSKECMNLKK